MMINVMAANRPISETGRMNTETNTIPQTHKPHKATYSLLMRSEERSRNLLELVIYALLILGPLLPAWQFAHQPVNIPAAGYLPNNWGDRTTFTQHIATAARPIQKPATAD
jgi:hypothetical protein